MPHNKWRRGSSPPWNSSRTSRISAGRDGCRDPRADHPRHALPGAALNHGNAVKPRDVRHQVLLLMRQERVLHGHPIEGLAVVQIFAENDRAPENSRRFDDRRIPVRDAVPLSGIHRRSHQRNGRLLDRPSKPCLHEQDRLLVAQSVVTRGARSLYEEFLKDLHGEGEILRPQQVACGSGFGGLVGGSEEAPTVLTFR
jgi:hypothetical protein